MRSLTEFTAATIFHYANEADPGWRDRYEDEERQRIFARMAAGLGWRFERSWHRKRGTGCRDRRSRYFRAGAGASSGAGAGSAGTAPPNPPLIPATPFVLRDPKITP